MGEYGRNYPSNSPILASKSARAHMLIDVLGDEHGMSVENFYGRICDDIVPLYLSGLDSQDEAAQKAKLIAEVVEFLTSEEGEDSLEDIRLAMDRSGEALSEVFDAQTFSSDMVKTVLEDVERSVNVDFAELMDSRRKAISGMVRQRGLEESYRLVKAFADSVPDGLKAGSYEEFVAPQHPMLDEFVKRFINGSVRNKKFLYLYNSTPGTGKSTAAFHIAKKIIAKSTDTLSATMIDELEFMDLASNDRAALKEIAHGYDIIIFDDFGISDPSLWTEVRKSALQWFIDARWSSETPQQLVIFTSNVEPEEINNLGQYGERMKRQTVSRMFSVMESVPYGRVDHRMAASRSDRGDYARGGVRPLPGNIARREERDLDLGAARRRDPRLEASIDPLRSISDISSARKTNSIREAREAAMRRWQEEERYNPY